MITPYDNAAQTRWDRGELRVQLNVAGNTRPMGYCEGTAQDEAKQKYVDLVKKLTA